MAFERTDVADAVPVWRGFHHVALVTPDLDATIRFYGDVLGMSVGEVVSATERQGRHCFIKPGATVETWGLHFFEQPDAEVFAYPETFERYAFVPGALQHVAFTLPDEAAALVLRRRLAAFGVEMTDITNLGLVSNMLFRDNNGLFLLEAAWARS
jgi:catechol 2,3-dioxygenase-like lactoylglutathione lyase family enzyme